MDGGGTQLAEGGERGGGVRKPATPKASAFEKTNQQKSGERVITTGCDTIGSV